MAQTQKEKESLKCTFKNCQELQTADGEFCKRHIYGIVHHPSNSKNCHACMDLWIERENEIAKKFDLVEEFEENGII